MSARSFKTKLGSGFIELPLDVRKEFGKARAPVKVSINGYRYRSTMAVYGGRYYVPVRRERREAAGVEAGDVVRVTIAPDTDLAAALAKNDLARAQWENLSYTPKKEYAEAILQAKKPETRARRIQNVLKDLSAKTK